MKKFSFLLSVILVFCLAFLTSCSSIFSSNKSGATVSFRLNQDVVKALASKVSSSRAGIPAELEGTMLYVTLYVNSKPFTQETPLTEEGAFITFENIVVGSEVSASVEVKKDSELLAAGTSSESLIVQKGENLLSVTLQFVADGQIFFGDHVTIQLASSSDEIWLNQGEWSFKLLDDSGNDILADVDWEARNESEPNNPLYNDYLMYIKPSVRKGHTTLVGESDYLTYFSIEENKLSMKQDWPLPQSGTMELTLTIMPASETYMSKSGKLKPFPQFEPVSTTVEINTKNVAGINMSDCSTQDIFSSTLSPVINSSASGTTLAFYGTTPLEYDDDVLYILKGILGNSDKIFDIDMSALSSTAEDKKIDFIDNRFEYCSKVSSFSFPDDLEEIGISQFQSCSNLKTIKLGKSLKKIGYQAFYGCSELKDVITQADCELTTICDSAFMSTAITNFTIPKSVIAIGPNIFRFNSPVTISCEDSSGQWYSAGYETLWNKWCDGELIPPDDGDTQGMPSEVADITAVDFTDTELYYYCKR